MSLVLQAVTLMCGVAGIVAISMWIVPNLQMMYASIGLDLPASVRLLISAGAYWWLFPVAAIGLFVIVGRGRAADDATRRRSIVVSASTLLAVVWFCAYAEGVMVAYSNSGSVALNTAMRLRSRIEADSIRAAAVAAAMPADTTARR